MGGYYRVGECGVAYTYWRVSIINFPVTKRTKNNVHLFLQYQTLSPYSTRRISKYLPLQRAKVCTQSRALLGPHPLNARRRMTFAVNLVFKPHRLAHRGTDILRVWCRWGIRVRRVALTCYRLDIGCTSPLTRLVDRTEAHCGWPWFTVRNPCSHTSSARSISFANSASTGNHDVDNPRPIRPEENRRNKYRSVASFEANKRMRSTRLCFQTSNTIGRRYISAVRNRPLARQVAPEMNSVYQESCHLGSTWDIMTTSKV